MNNRFINVNYSEIDKEEKKKDIKDELLFFTTSQVSELIGESDSCIRYWSKRFEHLLDLQVSNKNRQFKKSDVEKLKFIKKLIRDDGLTLQQVDDYINTKGFKIDDIEKSIIDANNPLAIQMFISAMTIEFDKKLNKFSEELVNQMNDKYNQYISTQIENNEKLQENIVRTIDEVVSDKLDSKLSDFKSYISQKELDNKARDIELLDNLKRSMELNKQKSENEEQEKENKKGFWSRILGR